MKHSQLIVHSISAVVLTAMLALVGCSKQEEPSVPPSSSHITKPPGAETAPAQSATQNALSSAQHATQVAAGKFSDLLKAFESAPPETRAIIQKAVDELSAGKYSEALQDLTKVAPVKLTDEQKQLLQQAIDYAKKQLGANPLGSATNLLKK